jgi:hypothetical protein
MQKESTMAKNHGSSVKNDKQYEGLRKKGMSKERAAKIANTPGASKRAARSRPSDRLKMELTGLEPVTYALPARRSSS